MDNHIADTCRFCLEDREEFQHLVFACPALWWERHTVSAQDQHHSSPDKWTPQQLLDFTLFPRINDAFAKPLHIAESMAQAQHIEQLSQAELADDIIMESDTDHSVMAVSSEADSSTQDDASETSTISIE